MPDTKPLSDQITFASAKTGTWNLDAYMEAVERGTRTLPDILSDLWDPTTGSFRSNIVQFRLNNGSDLQYRVGDFPDANTGWLNVTNGNIFRIRGTHTTATAYSRLDVVYANNATYICLADHTSTSANPSANFQLALNAPTANNSAFTPAGSISATNIQAAIEELDGDLQTRTLTAGTGLTGGGTLAANRTFAFDTTWGDARYALLATVNARTLTAGTGLTGGGDLSANRTFAFDTTWGDARYALISNTVAPTRTLTAGTGISGGGDLSANRSFAFDTTWGDARYAAIGRTLTAGTGISGGGDLSTNRSFAFDTTWGDARYAAIGRTITAGTGLTGGGDLSTNRSLAIDPAWPDGRYPRYDASQILSIAQQLQARLNLLTPPVDAAAALGILINPAMEVSQERGATAVTVGPSAGSPIGAYTVDQWVGSIRGTMVASFQQVANPFAVDGFRRIQNGLRVTITTAQASLGANDFLLVNQPIEGTFLAGLGLGTVDARGIDIAMVVQASVAGTYSISARNAALDRSWATNVTLAANTPTVILVPVAALTSGTWATDTAISAYISVSLGAGSALQTSTLNSWQTGNFPGHASTTNLAATLNATFTIGFAQAFPAGVLPFTSAAQITGENLARLLSMRRPQDDELRRCMRYWEPLTMMLIFSAGGASSYHGAWNSFLAPKRVLPTLTTNGDGANSNVTTAIWDEPRLTGCRAYIISGSSGITSINGRTGNASARM